MLKLYDRNGNERKFVEDSLTYTLLTTNDTIAGLMGTNENYPDNSRYRQESSIKIVDAPTQANVYIYYTKLNPSHILATSTTACWIGFYINSQIYWIKAGSAT